MPGEDFFIAPSLNFFTAPLELLSFLPTGREHPPPQPGPFQLSMIARTGMMWDDGNTLISMVDHPYISHEVMQRRLEGSLGVTVTDWLMHGADPATDPVHAMEDSGVAGVEDAQGMIDNARAWLLNTTAEERDNVIREETGLPLNEAPPPPAPTPPAPAPAEAAPSQPRPEIPPSEQPQEDVSLPGPTPGHGGSAQPPPSPAAQPSPAPQPPKSPATPDPTQQFIMQALQKLAGLLGGGGLVDLSSLTRLLGQSLPDVVRVLAGLSTILKGAADQLAKAAGAAADKQATATAEAGEKVASATIQAGNTQAAAATEAGNKESAATEKITQPSTLTEAIFKAALTNAEIDARTLDNLLPTIEEWAKLAVTTEEIPENEEEQQLEENSDALQSEFEGSTGPRVPHEPVETKGRVVSVDNVHPWVKLNQLAQEGASSKDIFDYFEAKEKEARASIDSRLQGWADSLFKKLTDFMFTEVKNLGKVGPEQGFDAAARLIQTALAAGMAAHISATLTEAVVPWKQLGLNQIVGFIADIGAFGPLVAETWGRAVHEAVGRASQYQVNQTTRSRLLEVRDVVEAFRKRRMDQGDFSQHLLYHGLDTDQQQIMLESIWRPPRLREIVLLAGDSSITQAEIAELLRFAGYSDEHVDLETPIVFQQAIKQQRQLVLSEIFTELKDGLIDTDSAELVFDQLRLQPEARSLIYQAAARARNREMIGEHEKVFTAQVNDGLISIDSYRASISALGLPDEKVDVLVSLADAKRGGTALKKEQAQIEKEVRQIQTLVVSNLKALFQSGQINQPMLLVLLEQTGLSPSFASAVTALEATRRGAKMATGDQARALKLTQQIVRERKAAIIESYRKGVFDEKALRENLLRLGLDRDIVDAVVLEETVRKIQPPKIAKTSTAK